MPVSGATWDMLGDLCVQCVSGGRCYIYTLPPTPTPFWLLRAPRVKSTALFDLSQVLRGEPRHQDAAYRHSNRNTITTRMPSDIVPSPVKGDVEFLACQC